MTTLANPKMRAAAVDWEKVYPSAVFAGIVGDAAHRARGGYHISIEDQPATNYSVVRVNDKAPPGNWARNEASALDMSMSKTDMIACTRRWMAVWSDRNDPRRNYFNAVNGWTGSGNAQRWDFKTNTVSTATNDHQWHVHGEVCRRYVNDPMAYKAMASILRGESKATWIKNNQVAPPPTKPVGKPGTRRLRVTSPGLMSGEDVKFVQRWIGGGVTVDGVYGPKTRSRVITWQKDMRGRTGTGVIDRVDWRDMGVTVTY